MRDGVKIGVYGKIAEKLLDMAEELANEAEKYLNMDKDCEAMRMKDAVIKVKKKHKMTYQMMADTAGISVSNIQNSIRYREKTSLHTATSWVKGLDAALCIIDKDGELYLIGDEDWGVSGQGFNKAKFANFLRQNVQDMKDEDAEVWFGEF